MKQKYLIAALVVVLVLGAFWFITKSNKTAEQVAIPMSEAVEREDLGMSFRYPDTYELRQMEGGLELNGLLMQGAFTISSTTEGLPVTSGFVFREAVDVLDETDVAAGVVSTTTEDTSSTTPLTKEEQLRAWAENNEALTSYESRTGEPSIVKVDGVDALFFTTNAGQLQDTYVIVYRNDMYLFVGQYETEGDVYQQNFKAFIDSIYFL